MEVRKLPAIAEAIACIRTRCFNGLPMLFQRSVNAVSTGLIFLQHHFNLVSTVCQRGFNGLSTLFQKANPSFNTISTLFQRSVNAVSTFCQRCFDRLSTLSSSSTLFELFSQASVSFNRIRRFQQK